MQIMTPPMTSRQRVLAALNHQQPDRVPIDFGGNQSGIHVNAYKNLVTYLGMEEASIKFSDVVQHTALISEKVLERFHADVRYLRPLSVYVDVEDPGLLYEGKFKGVWDALGVFWGVSAEKSLDQILYLDPVIHPLAEASTVHDVEAYNWPSGADATPFRGLGEHARDLHENTSYAVSTGTIGNVFEYIFFLAGFVKTLRLIRKKPDVIIAMMEQLLAYWKDYTAAFFKEVGKNVDIICTNGDLAEQSGPIIDPGFYAKHVMPRDKELVNHIKSLAPVKVNYHCCGSAAPFIPHFIQAGFDAFNPVQVSAHDMDPCTLHQHFGDKITFWGGLCNTQKTLPFGSPEQVRDEVRYNVACLKAGGGYIAANIHNISAEVPPQNIVAMFDAALEFGHYHLLVDL